MGTWKNNDGLYIKYGSDEGASTHAGGSYKVYGPVSNVVEVEIDLTELTETETIINDSIFVPKNHRVEWVEVVALEAAATGAAIDVGLIRASDRSTEIDYDGFLAAFVTATMDGVNEKHTFFGVSGSEGSIPASVTTGGALIGAVTSSTYVGMISASRTTSTAFTAGRVLVRIGLSPVV